MPTRLGQNFIRDPRLQERIAAAVVPRAEDLIIEVGGGLGDISARLASKAGRLLILELDSRLAAGLQSRFRETPNVIVLNANVLDVSFERLVAEHGSGCRRFRVFGNLPYYISSEILLRLCSASRLLTDATVMLQREVADRVLARSGPDYGSLSALVQLHSNPARLFDLPPGAFRPAPKVHSSLVRLEFHPRAAELGVDEKLFAGFLQTAFAHKRKQLINNLRSLYPAEAIVGAYRSMGLEPQVRAEQLPLEKLAEIHRSLQGAIEFVSGRQSAVDPARRSR